MSRTNSENKMNAKLTAHPASNLRSALLFCAAFCQYTGIPTLMVPSTTSVCRSDRIHWCDTPRCMLSIVSFDVCGFHLCFGASNALVGVKFLLPANRILNLRHDRNLCCHGCTRILIVRSSSQHIVTKV